MKKCKPYQPLTDKTPKYTIKEAAEILELSPHTIRYYDKIGIVPAMCRTDSNIRLFSDFTISWLRLIHCLRATGLSIDGVKHYIQLCLDGDSTIPERAELIFKQEAVLRAQIDALEKQMAVLEYKKAYYQKLLASGSADPCNPATQTQEEPNIVSQVG
ncbi:MAG: MerR family transcriptional regulator [Planctomycetia bacterium]|nr:MerR family transcriptional regulator [Planctomycetia bacterium]